MKNEMKVQELSISCELMLNSQVFSNLRNRTIFKSLSQKPFFYVHAIFQRILTLKFH